MVCMVGLKGRIIINLEVIEYMSNISLFLSLAAILIVIDVFLRIEIKKARKDIVERIDRAERVILGR